MNFPTFPKKCFANNREVIKAAAAPAIRFAGERLNVSSNQKRKVSMKRARYLISKS
jgi:hypothetical protein